jgi:hypothetical protein
MYIENHYYDFLALLSYYTVTCIVLYIFGPVATHGHAPSLSGEIKAPWQFPMLAYPVKKN